MVEEFNLPPMVTRTWLIVTFVAALVVFHAGFVWLGSLRRRDWIIIEYIWLLTAFFGVLGSLGGARRIVAENMRAMAANRLEFHSSMIIERIEFGTSSAVCRQFIRNEFSPPEAELDRLQAGYDSLCSWFTAAKERAPLELSERASVTLAQLGGVPPPLGGDRETVQDLAKAVEYYNGTLAVLGRLDNAAERSEGEMVFDLLGPYMVIIALALRVTKATGEARLGGGGAFKSRKRTSCAEQDSIASAGGPQDSPS